MTPDTPQTQNDSSREPRPPLGSWNRVYLAVLCNLGILILLFWLFSKAFS